MTRSNYELATMGETDYTHGGKYIGIPKKDLYNWIIGLPETLVITHYKIVNGDSLCDPRMTFARINHKHIPVSWQNDFAGMNKTILQWNDEKEDWLVSDPPALLAAINFFNTVWMDNIASFYEF